MEDLGGKRVPTVLTPPSRSRWLIHPEPDVPYLKEREYLRLVWYQDYTLCEFDNDHEKSISWQSG